MATIIVGGQWGDEGKGKVVAYLCKKDEPDVVARAGVGPNAGHTVTVDGRKYGLRLTPSGFVHPEARLLIGAGVLVNPDVLVEEISELETGGRIGVDERCGIIEEDHIRRDKGSKHLKGTIGSTGTGCGPANMDRAKRVLKLAREIDELKPYLTDVAMEINHALRDGKRVYIEGSQGFGLSLFYGTYPYVTSKDTSASAAAVDVGLGPRSVKEVIVILKSFPSRVGAGPFPTELSEEEERRLGIEEYGTVTGRKRRAGMFDFEGAKYAAMVNSASQIAITCLDYVDRECSGVREYSKLTSKARGFLEEVEKKLEVPVTLISTGPGLEDVIDMRGEKL
ncbi:MAG: adenylosuccinate synthetase [Candidatus Hydrothermarchaeaceae archaeon]